MNWADTFRTAPGSLSQAEAAASISGLLSVRTVQDWELGRRQPPAWVQPLVLAVLRRAAGGKPLARLAGQPNFLPESTPGKLGGMNLARRAACDLTETTAYCGPWRMRCAASA